MRDRTLWLVLGICLVVLVVVIPIAAPDHRIDVRPLAIWGGAVSILCGALGAVIWIAKSHGRPFGSRDLELDRSSPYLRENRRWAVLAGIGMLATGLAANAFAVSWYPNPHPDVGRTETPEEYALGILVGAWFMLLLGTYWLVLEVYWSRVLVQCGRK